MNKDLDLVGILKNVPKGTKLYSPLFGDVEFIKVSEDEEDYPIKIKTLCGVKTNDGFTSKGTYLVEYSNSECTLFPDKNQRDWSKFNYLFHDKSLVWCWNNSSKYTRFFGFYDTSSGTIYNPITGTKESLLYYDHYELYEGITPDWAIDVITELKD